MLEIKIGDQFTKWIRMIRSSNENKNYVLERIECFRAKLKSCNSTNLQMIPVCKSNVPKNLTLHYLCKIEVLEEELTTIDQSLDEYRQLTKQLTNQEQQVLNEVIINGCKAIDVAKDMRISRTRLYDIRNNIVRKWGLYFVATA